MDTLHACWSCVYDPFLNMSKPNLEYTDLLHKPNFKSFLIDLYKPNTKIDPREVWLQPQTFKQDD